MFDGVADTIGHQRAPRVSSASTSKTRNRSPVRRQARSDATMSEQCLGNDLEHGIPRTSPIRFVELLEIVDVQDQARQREMVADGALPFASHERLDELKGWYAGERIRAGQPPKLVFQLGDATGGTQPGEQFALLNRLRQEFVGSQIVRPDAHRRNP